MSKRPGNLHESLKEWADECEAGMLTYSELGDLISFNYTDQATYDRHWTPVTLSSRGTIYDRRTGEVVARSFDKFFNLGEHTSTIDNLPNFPFVAMEKVDGSLGIVFVHEGKLRVATRGSFYSDQAVKATEMIQQEPYNSSFKTLIENGYTPLVEIIYPENRIITDYGQSNKLVLLAVRDRLTGEYRRPRENIYVCKARNIPYAEIYSYTLDQLLEMKKTINWQQEGWVLVYENGFRVKVKGDDYCRIAKIKSCLSPLSMWEAMVAGKAEEYIAEMPDEIHAEADEIYQRLDKDLWKIQDAAVIMAHKLGLYTDTLNFKALALSIKNTAPTWMHGVLFMIMRKQTEKAFMLLLALIRPDANKYVDVKEKYNA